MPSGIEHGLFALIENSGSRIAGLSLYRGRNRGAFEAHDKTRLDTLVPHLQRAFRFHADLARLKSRCEGTESALNEIPFGVIFFGPQSNIMHMNRQAQLLVSVGDGLKVSRNNLHAENRVEDVTLGRIIAAACTNGKKHGSRRGASLDISRRVGSPLKVQINDLHTPGVLVSELVVAIAFVHDKQHTPSLGPESLLEKYRLTPAESRVALLLSDGRSPREIAGTLGVTFNTVRSQIKNVYAKTSVRRQSEFVRLLIRGFQPRD